MRIFNFDASEGPDPPDASERSDTPIGSEATVESWLHANPTVLLDEPILIFGRQYSVETGIPDLLALDQYANVIVFELKAGLSGSGSASEETIQSQPQNYASSLSTYDYKELDEVYQTYRADVLEDRWEVDHSIVESPTLEDAFERRFGEPPDSRDYNQHQRIVIVAETITQQTATNARYLLDHGLNVQCLEVQWFPQSDTATGILATSVIVDYDTSRIRPERYDNPSYPDLVAQIARHAFPELRELVHAERLNEVMTGLDGRNPDLKSNNPGHPDVVKYSIRLKPDFGHVRVVLGLDWDDNDVLEQIRAHEDEFKNSGFDEVSHTRSQQRIVLREWEIDHAERLEEEEFRAEIAQQFVRLVEIGHDILGEKTSIE